MATTNESVALEKPEAGHITQRTPTIEDLMSQAIATGNVEVMKETFQMWLTLKAETARETYNRKLKEFKAVCPPIKKDKAVKNKDQSLRYKYAPLETCIKIAGPHLTDHGFSWDFDSKLSQHGQELFCTLRHEAGHSETRSATAPIDSDAHMNVDQQHGSAESYAKRRAFLNVTGLVPEGEDTDANPRTENHISDAQLKVLKSLFDKLEKSRHAGCLDHMGNKFKRSISSLEDIPASRYNEAHTILSNALRERPQTTGPATVNDVQVMQLQEVIEGIGKTCKAEFLTRFEIKKIGDLPSAKYTEALEWLEQKRRG